MLIDMPTQAEPAESQALGTQDAGVVTDTPRFTLADLDAARVYYESEGYVVLRDLLSVEQCDRVMEAFDREARFTSIPILRQKNMKYETNRFTKDGFLENPIFNVQDLQTSGLGIFKHAVLDTLTCDAVAKATAFLLGAPRTKVIQSMFFEAPAGTWPHQDSYYQDSASGLGNATACWFALEDISDNAGRFYVCPRTHRSIKVLKNEGKQSFAGGHDVYKQTMQDMIRANELPVVAPELKKGDVLLWSSLTVHGSFPGGPSPATRRSLTAHYLREADDMLQFHTRIRHQPTIVWNGMEVGLLHDQDKVWNRLVRDLAYKFPKPYMLARSLALKALLATQTLRGSAAPSPAN
jgi:phytanoyl-CoA hydroxylase